MPDEAAGPARRGRAEKRQGAGPGQGAGPEAGPGQGAGTPAPAAQAAPVRRRQQERSAEARRRLCEATIDCLATHGYAGTTTQRVAEMAGLSRGAMQHHYGSKLDLVTAAAEYLLDGALARTIETVHRLKPGGDDRFRTLVHQLWRRLVASPRYDAVLEVFVAVRSDADLRARIDTVLRRLSLSLAEAMGTLFRPRPGVEADPALLVGMTFTLLRGLSLEAGIYRDPVLVERVLDSWATMLADRLRFADETEGTADPMPLRRAGLG